MVLIFMRNSLCLNVLNNSNSVQSRCMCAGVKGGGGGGGVPRYFDGGVCG